MKKVMIVFFISVVIFSILYYFLKDKVVSTENKTIVFADQIKLDELGNVIGNLVQNKLEFDFFGITSNGIDCIYFVMDGTVINIDFEIMREEQKQYLERYKYYARRKGYELKETTYGNKSNYDGPEEAPVYKIVINGDKALANQVGMEIQNEVFRNDLNTSFEVVP